MEWQFYWRKWYLGRKWQWSLTPRVRINYLFLGPLQIKWYTRAW